LARAPVFQKFPNLLFKSQHRRRSLVQAGFDGGDVHGIYDINNVTGEGVESDCLFEQKHWGGYGEGLR
jgi:hypothetical protein